MESTAYEVGVKVFPRRLVEAARTCEPSSACPRRQALVVGVDHRSRRSSIHPPLAISVWPRAAGIVRSSALEQRHDLVDGTDAVSGRQTRVNGDVRSPESSLARSFADNASTGPLVLNAIPSEWDASQEGSPSVVTAW